MTLVTPDLVPAGVRVRARDTEPLDVGVVWIVDSPPPSERRDLVRSRHRASGLDSGVTGGLGATQFRLATWAQPSMRHPRYRAHQSFWLPLAQSVARTLVCGGRWTSAGTAERAVGAAAGDSGLRLADAALACASARLIVDPGAASSASTGTATSTGAGAFSDSDTGMDSELASLAHHVSRLGSDLGAATAVAVAAAWRLAAGVSATAIDPLACAALSLWATDLTLLAHAREHPEALLPRRPPTRRRWDRWVALALRARCERAVAAWIPQVAMVQSATGYAPDTAGVPHAGSLDATALLRTLALRADTRATMESLTAPTASEAPVSSSAAVAATVFAREALRLQSNTASWTQPSSSSSFPSSSASSSSSSTTTSSSSSPSSSGAGPVFAEIDGRSATRGALAGPEEDWAVLAESEAARLLLLATRHPGESADPETEAVRLRDALLRSVALEWGLV